MGRFIRRGGVRIIRNGKVRFGGSRPARLAIVAALATITQQRIGPVRGSIPALIGEVDIQPSDFHPAVSETVKQRRRLPLKFAESSGVVHLEHTANLTRLRLQRQSNLTQLRRVQANNNLLARAGEVTTDGFGDLIDNGHPRRPVSGTGKPRRPGRLAGMSRLSRMRVNTSGGVLNGRIQKNRVNARTFLGASKVCRRCGGKCCGPACPGGHDALPLGNSRLPIVVNGPPGRPDNVPRLNQRLAIGSMQANIPRDLRSAAQSEVRAALRGLCESRAPAGHITHAGENTHRYESVPGAGGWMLLFGFDCPAHGAGIEALLRPRSGLHATCLSRASLGGRGVHLSARGLFGKAGLAIYYLSATWSSCGSRGRMTQQIRAGRCLRPPPIADGERMNVSFRGRQPGGRPGWFLLNKGIGEALARKAAHIPHAEEPFHHKCENRFISRPALCSVDVGMRPRNLTARTVLKIACRGLRQRC